MSCLSLIRLCPLRRSIFSLFSAGVRTTPLLPALLCAAVLACPIAGVIAFSGLAHAADKNAAAQTQTRPDNQPAQQPAATEKSFSFLGVGKTALIDSTRKSDFEDYKLRPEHSCAGCWCSHAFGDRPNESQFDLHEQSPVFQSAWKHIETCQDAKYNSVPQIRSLLLQPKYSDTAYAKVVLYFSELLNKPLAFTLTAAHPDNTLEELTRRFGAPEIVDDTWYLWRKDGDLLVYDLFDKKYKKKEFGIIYVYFLSALDSHVARVHLETDLALQHHQKKKK